MKSEDSFWLFVWETIATIGIIVVILGIIGEGSELVSKWALKLKYKKRQDELDDGSRWFLAVLLKFIRPRILEVETFAFAMVIVGLMAEFWGGHKAQGILDENNSQLNLQSAQLNSTNKQLSLRIEELRKANDDLEYKNSQRLYVDQESAAERLKKFSGTPVVVISQNDRECIKTARQISWVLDLAKWNRLEPTRILPPHSELFEGIKIAVNDAGIDRTNFEFEAQNQAVKLLVKELLKSEMEAGPTAANWFTNFPRGFVIVQVGHKPSFNSFLYSKYFFDSTDPVLTPEKRFDAWNKMLEVNSNVLKEDEEQYRGKISGGNEAN